MTHMPTSPRTIRYSIAFMIPFQILCITTIKTPMNLSVSGLYLILAGIGLFFLVLSISTKDQKSVRTWAIYSGIFYGIALLCGSLISFRSGHIITAKIVALCGTFVILLTLYSIISTLRRGKQHE